MDEFFRSQQSPRGDSHLNVGAFVSPPRTVPQLPRRFTTDSGRVPTLSSITNMRGSDNNNNNNKDANMTDYKVQLLEKKKAEYERIREQKRRFEVEMYRLDQQQRDEEKELARLAVDLGRYGHQSEPTTPPEYRDSITGFPGVFSRPNRYSTSSLISPPGFFTRPGRSGSQLTSPPPGLLQSLGTSRFPFDDHLPSRSVPASRRNSDEDEKEEAVRQDPTSHRSTNALNRYSMPVTRSRSYISELNNDSSIDSNNTTGFLFGDEDSGNGEKSYQAANQNDVFPHLRNSAYGNMLSATSTTLDSAQGQTGALENTSANGWGSIRHHRPQQSLSILGSAQLANNSSGTSGPPSEVSTIGSRTPRHSMDLKGYQIASPGGSDMSGTTAAVSQSTAHHGNIMATPPKMQQPYSANEVPALKSTNGASAMSPMSANANNHAQQHFHNHNLNSGRYPAGAQPNNRHSREMSSENNNLAASRETSSYGSINSTLHANAPTFGPINPPTVPPGAAAPYAPNPYPYYQPPASYNGAANGAGYGGPQNGYAAVNMGMQALSVNGHGGQPMYQPPQTYHPYNNGNMYQGQVARVAERDSQARVIQSRRAMDNEVMSRFNNMDLESCTGQIYELCKDQHGCRFLQKQLEQRDPHAVHKIWLETNQHVIELMIDPFGNYLCQKLLEFCNDEERTVLIQNAAQDMVRIALNQHGTRALQKMIEYVSTSHQVEIIVNALRNQVVDLIQDLNGNHVIQKCLNKLSAPEAQFIFDAVGNHCVEVGTHRHGCCVLQRCIDHASGEQKAWLIQKITESAYPLVRDPFGNYVVQYIIDLNDPKYTEPIVGQFRGKISDLSRHKFSSNVIEKCLRCSHDVSKDLIVEELVQPGEMDKLLRDNYANYVVQTAMDFATPPMKHRLVEVIRPLLPGVRSTPYGRRIQTKITQYDNRNGTGPVPSSATASATASAPNSAMSSALNSGANSNAASCQVTPVEGNMGQVAERPPHQRLVGNNNSVLNAASPLAKGSKNGSSDGSSVHGSVTGNTDVNGTMSNGTATPTRASMAYQNAAQPPRAQQQFVPLPAGQEHWL